MPLESWACERLARRWYPFYARSVPELPDVAIYVERLSAHLVGQRVVGIRLPSPFLVRDRKSTRLNSSHVESSYAVFCLKKKESVYLGLPMDGIELAPGLVEAGPQSLGMARPGLTVFFEDGACALTPLAHTSTMVGVAAS